MTGQPIRLDRLRKNFGKTEVIQELSAEIAGGEFTVILGPSGCGKSTLLNMIAGLEAVSAGRIDIGGEEVQDREPKDRGCAMVFQNYALYPHMSVAGNIGYALKVAGVAKAERMRRIGEVARIVELGNLLDRKPSELSGGQRQRVAIARAIVREPKVLLFDEPLSNLDAQLRHGMRMELRELHNRIGATSVFVTHDQVEAMTLADRILILNKGRIEQFGTPAEVYHQPATRFVAEFLGSPPMNLVEVVGDGSSLRLTSGEEIAPSKRSGHFLLGIRPENVSFASNGIPASLAYREDLGSHAVLALRLPENSLFRVATPLGHRDTLADRLALHLPAEHIHLFCPESGQSLSTTNN